MFKLFIEPLKKLNLNIVEYCLLFSIALFHPEPSLSSIGQQHLQRSYDNFVKLLYEFILENKRSSILLLNEAFQHQINFEVSKRMSEIMGLVNILQAVNLTYHGLIGCPVEMDFVFKG
uniref:NR LBD domain-containing protein n=1 Tax=Panagrolaimus sp. PS1159 TaxID=55785 RepID=A0AC35FUP5_9BILA